MPKTSLTEKLVHSKRDAGGTIAKNRLTFQVSYGIHLIMEFFNTDSVIFIDYFEDIAILNSPDNPDTIRLYQIKTTDKIQPLYLTAVISEKWVQKLYANAQQYGEHFEEGHLVCNDDIISEQTKAFVNLKNCLKDPLNAVICDKLKSVIAKDLKIAENDVDLEKFYLIRTHLSTMNHKSEVEHNFETFLLNEREDIQVTMARTIYKSLYEILDVQFNREYPTQATDLTEIIKNKGIKISDANGIVKTAVRRQVPQKDKIFDYFKVTSLKDRQKLGTAYARVKGDMYESDNTFSVLKDRINDCIKKNEEVDIEKILDKVYSEISKVNNCPEPYKEENFLRLLIMILIIQYGCE